MLRLNELTVRRGAAVVVERLDWQVGPGRPAWIVGPNGAGKSSLLRVIAGLLAPAAGSVSLPAGVSRPLYFHAETGLPPDATVGGWKRLMDALLSVDAPSRTALWPPVPDRRRAGDLSTGERKRLLLDTLLRQPGGALLLDEPYEHLSPDAKATLSALIEARSRDAVVIVATNQLTDLAIRDGGVRLEGGVATAFAGTAG